MTDTSILDDVWERLRQAAISRGRVTISTLEAQALLNELARLRCKVRAVADWLRYHAHSEGGFVAELLDHAPYDGPSSVPVTDGPTLVEIAAERDALRSRVAEIEREHDALRITPEAIR